MSNKNDDLIHEIESRLGPVVDQQDEMIRLEEELFGAALDDIMSLSEFHYIEVKSFSLAQDPDDPGAASAEALDRRPLNCREVAGRGVTSPGVGWAPSIRKCPR